MTTPRILLTPGEPAGVGPDVTIMAAQQAWDVDIIAVADPDMLHARAELLNLPLTCVEVNLQNKERTSHQPQTLRVAPVKLSDNVTPGKLNPDHAAYDIKTLDIAANACLNKQADSLVTGPVQKSIINDAGFPFSGHTEFLADVCKVKQTVMLFVVDDLKVALATTHLPLKDVAAAISKEKLSSIIQIMHHDISNNFHIANPHILVAGLNPHAGEDGHLGREEIDVITPAIKDLQKQGISIEGPLPADTLFTHQHLQKADAVLAMYHDQALPLIKYIGFDRAVNVTLGLPFIRTSVDHGTALDIAGSGKANAGSMLAAIKLAIAS